jgi:hypothetical protein
MDTTVPAGNAASKEPTVHPSGMTDDRIKNVGGMMPTEK